MSGFLAMGGYAAFVWPAYGISAAGLALMVALTLRAYRRARAKLAAMGERTP
jgi:heme exporter protein D